MTLEDDYKQKNVDDGGVGGGGFEKDFILFLGIFTSILLLSRVTSHAFWTDTKTPRLDLV